MNDPWSTISQQRHMIEALQSRELELTDFLECSVVAMHRADECGRILWANQAELDLLGYRREEYVGHLMEEFHDDHEALREMMARLARNEVIENFEARLRCKNGSVRYVLISSNVRWQEGQFMHTRSFTRDITERKHSESELHLLQSIALAVNEVSDLASALKIVLRHICKATGCVLGQAWMPHPNRHHLAWETAWHEEDAGAEEFCEHSGRWIFPFGRGLPGHVWQSKRPQWLADLACEDNFPRASLAQRTGVHAALALPVIVGNDVVCVVEFFFSSPREHDDNIIKLVARIATQVGPIIQRKQAEEALRDSEERFRLLVEGVKGYAIFMLDPTGHIASWNEGATRIIGYASEEILGQNFACMFVPDDVAAGKAVRTLRLAEDEGRFEEEGWRMRKDGVRFWADTVTTALRDSGGNLRGFSQIIRDESDRKRAEQAAEERTQEMEAFLSIAAHDLKRPLVSVQGLLTIMSEAEDAGINAENRQMLELALEECSRMRQLLKELDKLVQIERSATAREPANLRQVVDACVQRLSARSSARNAVIDVECPDVNVMLARMQVEEALTNLIENALLYGCVDDHARVEIHGSVSAGFASICVTDFGPGIPPEHHQRVFQLFRRLDPTGPVAGSGVGLAAVLRLIRRIGGTVGLQSDVGKGATFTISFPAEAVAGDVAPATPAPRTREAPPLSEPPAPNKPVDILLVEDDPVHAEIIQRAVRATPISKSLHHVTDGDLAIDFVHHRGRFADTARFPRPELILLDIRMPRMDGFEVLEHLKADASTRDIPVIMVSTSDRPEDIDRSIAGGAVDYVTKPVDQAELSRKIARGVTA